MTDLLMVLGVVFVWLCILGPMAMVCLVPVIVLSGRVYGKLRYIETFNPPTRDELENCGAGLANLHQDLATLRTNQFSLASGMNAAESQINQNIMALVGLLYKVAIGQAQAAAKDAEQVLTTNGREDILNEIKLWAADEENPS